jgi:hypothetical protein
VPELWRGQDCGKQFYFWSRKYFEFQSIADNEVFLGQKMALGDPAPGPLLLPACCLLLVAWCVFLVSGWKLETSITSH